MVSSYNNDMEHTAPEMEDSALISMVIICSCLCSFHLENNLVELMANFLDHSPLSHLEEPYTCESEERENGEEEWTTETDAVTYLAAHSHTTCREPEDGKEHTNEVCGVSLGTVGMANSSNCCMSDDAAMAPHEDVEASDHGAEVAACLPGSRNPDLTFIDEYFNGYHHMLDGADNLDS